MSNTHELPIHIRHAVPSDENMIYSFWVNSVSDMYSRRNIPKAWVKAAQRALIAKILKKSDVLIGCDIHNDDQVFGYMVANLTGGVLHWIYTKNDFRNYKVADRLVGRLLSNHETIVCTHPTPIVRKLVDKWNILRFDFGGL